MEVDFQNIGLQKFDKNFFLPRIGNFYFKEKNESEIRLIEFALSEDSENKHLAFELSKSFSMEIQIECYLQAYYFLITKFDSDYLDINLDGNTLEIIILQSNSENSEKLTFKTNKIDNLKPFFESIIDKISCFRLLTQKEHLALEEMAINLSNERLFNIQNRERNELMINNCELRWEDSDFSYASFLPFKNLEKFVVDKDSEKSCRFICSLDANDRYGFSMMAFANSDWKVVEIIKFYSLFELGRAIMKKGSTSKILPYGYSFDFSMHCNFDRKNPCVPITKKSNKSWI
ncbi:MAG: hypothetical protein MUC49_02230 [Raineya sp.]|jgi:ribosome biogenesis protein Nip4|nr:hypothetical protein [Raineya sp.]